MENDNGGESKSLKELIVSELDRAREKIEDGDIKTADLILELLTNYVNNKMPDGSIEPESAKDWMIEKYPENAKAYKMGVGSSIFEDMEEYAEYYSRLSNL